MSNRICSCCGLEKLETDFRKEKYKKQCKQCLNIKSLQYNKKNANKIKEYSKTYQQGDKRKEYITKYYQLNKSELMVIQKEYEYKKYHNDPAYRLRRIVSAAIAKSLKSKNLFKNKSSFTKHVSYKMQELKKHLESQFESWMSWNNHGKYNSKTWNDNDSSTWTWQIDHIIPHSRFLYVTMKSQCFQDCWALINLRPLNAKQNLMDGVTKNRHIVGDKND